MNPACRSSARPGAGRSAGSRSRAGTAAGRARSARSSRAPCGRPAAGRPAGAAGPSRPTDGPATNRRSSRAEHPVADPAEQVGARRQRGAERRHVPARVREDGDAVDAERDAAALRDQARADEAGVRDQHVGRLLGEQRRARARPGRPAGAVKKCTRSCRTSRAPVSLARARVPLRPARTRRSRRPAGSGAKRAPARGDRGLELRPGGEQHVVPGIGERADDRQPGVDVPGRWGVAANRKRATEAGPRVRSPPVRAAGGRIRHSQRTERIGSTSTAPARVTTAVSAYSTG